MGEEEATMRERIVEGMARALFAQGEREGGNPDFSDTSATVDCWFSLREDAHGEDADCYRICQEYRRAATAALDAALDLLETPSQEMWRAGDEAGNLATHGGSMRVLAAMLATLRSPKI